MSKLQYLTDCQIAHIACVSTAELYDLKIFSTAALTLNYDLDPRKLIMRIGKLAQILDICAKFRENRTCSCREITASLTNQQTNKQTRVITIPHKQVAMTVN